MAMLNSDIRMYRDALSMGGDKKKKKKNLPDWVNQKPGTVAKENPLGKLSSSKNKSTLSFNEMNQMDKKFRPSGDVKKKKENALEPIKREFGAHKQIKTGNPADLISPSLLKVNKKHQKRVNKVLGY